MSVQEKAPEKVVINNATDPPRMVHLSFDTQAPFVGLCGTPLIGKDANGRRVDCIVCVGLWGGEPGR